MSDFQKPLFVYYPKCGTCQKALKWLKANEIAVELRDIVIDNPKIEELEQWHEMSKLPLKKFFNTSGLVYKSMDLKNVLPNATPEQQLELLASEGKLVKRPILVYADKVLVGFKESDYEALFKK